MILAKPNVKYINTVTHEGKVLIVASVVEASGTKLLYTVKQDGFEDSALENPNGSGWEEFKVLELPNDSVGDPSVAEQESQNFTDTNRNYLIRSVYKSADLTAAAPVQLVSHNGYVYLFRQSTLGTLLVDRFVLDGMTNSLNQTLEVRYRRSRQRYKPIKAMKINSGGQMEAIDALDFRDMQNQPFYEPTTEIGPKLLNGLLDGWFGVVVNPTQEVEGYRWHFFIYNAQSQRIDTLTLHSGDEQIFTLRDYTLVSIDDLTNAVTYTRVPGIIQQKIALQDSQGQPLLVNNGLAAVKYDVQYEDQTATGPQLLRDASKIMLAVPTDAGIATLNFAIADDGTLAQIVPDVQNTVLRSRQSEVLLPLTVLDNIRAVGDKQPAPSGTIVGMSQSTEENTAEQVRVQVADADQPALTQLSRGDVVKLANTTSYNGLYQVASVADNNAFTINAPFTYGEVGDWEKVETEDIGLIFDGMITGYQKVGPGVLQVNALNHGLETGDWVQIVDSPDLAGEYPILAQDANSFTVQRLWVNGEAVNLKLESRKRRGLIFDGKNDWIEVPLNAPLTLTVGFAMEAWVKLNSAQNQTILATVPDAPYTQGGVSRGWQATLGVNNGKLSFAFVPLNLPGIATQRLDSPTPVNLSQWVHVACALDDKVLRLLENGVVVATLPVATLDKAALDAYTAWLTQVRTEVKRQEATTALHALPAQHPANYDRGRLVVRQSGNALSGERDATLVLGVANEQSEQQWRLEGVRPAGTQGATTTFAIYNLATQLVLDNSGKQVAWQNLDSQLWLLDSTNDGYFQLRSKQNNLVLSEQDGQLRLQAALLPGSPALVQQQWWFEALGEGKVNHIRTVLKLLEANQPRAGTAISFNTSTLTLAGQISTAEVGKAVKSAQLLLQGQLADVRLWNSGRTDQDILNNMHLRLTGREAGLVGDWPLGGVSVDEEDKQQVFDFSVAANQGIVHGAPYGGGVTLGRTLRDNVTLATQYSNDELFAVRVVTYVESFEFRTDVPVDPKNADGKEGAIFKPSIWGKMSRSAETRQTIPLSEPDFQFEALADGWYRATCRFLPQGPRLVRCFEISDVKGNWQTLEIRRHRIQYISSVVTFSQIEATAKVPSLVNPLLGLTDPIATLRQIERSEQEEAPLVTRQKELEALLAAATDLDTMQKRVNDLTQNAERLKNLIAAREADYNKLLADPFSYWHRIGTKVSGPKYIFLRSPDQPDGSPIVLQDPSSAEHGLWQITLIEDPLHHYAYQFFRIYSKTGSVCLSVHFGAVGTVPTLAAVHVVDESDSASRWRFEQVASGRFRLLSSSYYNEYLCPLTPYSNENTPYYVTRSADDPATIWEFEKTDLECEKLPALRRELDKLRYELKLTQSELEPLKAALSDTASHVAQWQQELQPINAQLASIRQRISQLTTSYLNLVVSLNTTAQTMLDLPGQADPRGLKVQAALLPFAQAASRLHALESCTGQVVLTYQDQWGQLHQTRYDTSYDADGKGEEWLPDTYRAALVLNGNRPALTLPTRIFSTVGTQITIEFWAKGGSNLPQALTFLGATDGQNGPCLRIQLPNEKGEIVWEAGTKPEAGSIDRLTQPANPRLYRERWTHWAFVKDSAKGEMKVYVNGHLWHANNPKDKAGVVLKQPIAPIMRAALGGLPDDSSTWQGQLAELRIWNVALTERELEANSLLTLKGNEPGLVVYYSLNEAQGDLVRDVTGQGRHLSVTGSSWAACSAPLGRLYNYIDLLEKPASFDSQIILAQARQLQLNFSEGFAIETLVRFSGSQLPPYIFSLNNGPGNQQMLLCNDLQTKLLTFTLLSNSQAYTIHAPNLLPLNEWLYLAVTIQKDGLATLYVNGSEKARGQMVLPGTTLGAGSYAGQNNWSWITNFPGQMNFARVYESALSAAEIGQYSQQHPLGRELLNGATSFDGQSTFVQLPAMNLNLNRGLTIEAYVRFDAFNSWSRIIDLANGPNNQNILLANDRTTNTLCFTIYKNGTGYALRVPNALRLGEWVYVTATIQPSGQAKLYVNGVEKASGQMALPVTVLRNQCYVGKSNWSNDALFKGQMNFVRVYESVLSSVEIWRNAQSDIPRPFNSQVSFISTEYSRVIVDAQQRKDAMMMRTLAWATDEGVRLLDQQRIEALDLKWIGNAQIKPTLIGYIEGAPPVPSENLTQEDRYNSAAAVELVQSSNVAYSWTRETNHGFGEDLEAFIGEKSSTDIGGGLFAEVFTSAEETEARVVGTAQFARSWQSASSVGASHSLLQRDRLELRGNQELEANFPVLGKRFIPKNVGYALVTSGLADIFVSKLRRTGRMVGYQVLPVAGVPLDVNTITFLINPAYTMAGSLDGMTGTQATSQRFFRQVPEMRAQYGSLYPASYLRLAEAYRLKADIERQDQGHQAYFNQFSAYGVREADLAAEIGSDTDTPVSLNTLENNTGASSSALGEIDKKITAKSDELVTLQKATPLDQAAIDRCKAELDDLRTERSRLLQQLHDDEGTAASKRQRQIESAYSDLSTRAHATASFAGWQRNMENLQARAGKRNIVNTYVWDGDGGLHVEEQQFASTVEHSVGSSLEMNFSLGVEASLAFAKVWFGGKFIPHATLTQTMSKTEANSTGLELHVDLSGVESRGITDYNDYPLLPGEKVDRYRFMSFFLENNTDHWHDFFAEVVDPEWLNSNDEEARALRQTRNGRPNKVWRVLHRVTYVERPALMGFGRQIPNTTSTVTTLQQLRAQVKELNKRLDLLQNDLTNKLDQVLSKL